MHRACNIVLILFYVRTTEICVCNRVKNWENPGLTTFLVCLFVLEWHQIITTLYVITKHTNRNANNSTTQKL